MKLTTSNKICISTSKIKNAGRGVFASNTIKAGEVIEKCPIIYIPEDDLSNINGSLLVTYFFYYGKDKNKSAIALGFGSIYNHSDKPNAKYKILSGKKRIDFIALKDISKDEEITINYSRSPKRKAPLWFDTDSKL